MSQFLMIALLALSVLQGCAKGNSLDTSTVSSNMPGTIAADAQ